YKDGAGKDDHPVVARTTGNRGNILRNTTAISHDLAVIYHGHAVAGVRVDSKNVPADCAEIRHCRSGAATNVDSCSRRIDQSRIGNRGRSAPDLDADSAAFDLQTANTKVIEVCVDRAVVCDRTALG